MTFIYCDVLVVSLQEITMASGSGEPSTGHDAELDELLDSKFTHEVFFINLHVTNLV